jgi:hypothetical protein
LLPSAAIGQGGFVNDIKLAWIHNGSINMKNGFDGLSEEEEGEVLHRVGPQLCSFIRGMLNSFPGDSNQHPLTGTTLMHRVLLSLWRSCNLDIFARQAGQNRELVAQYPEGATGVDFVMLTFLGITLELEMEGL